MNKLLCWILLLFICSCVQTTEKQQAVTKKPLLSDEELFNDNSEKINEIEQACINVGRAFQNAQILALSTGDNLCLVLENESQFSTIKIFKLIQRGVPPQIGKLQAEHKLSSSVRFVQNATRYFYCDYARRIDFDGPDVRLVTRKKQPNADIVIEYKGSNERGLVDFTKNSPTIRYYP